MPKDRIKSGSPEWTAAQKEVYEIMLELQPEWQFNEAQKRCASILLAGVYVGHSDTRISRFTGLSRGFIIPRAKRLKEIGIWTDNDITNANWADEKLGSLEFALDVMVLNGELEKKWVEESE